MCRGFEVEDGKASILLNTSVYGDITMVVYHARSAFGGKVQGKVCYIIVVCCCLCQRGCFRFLFPVSSAFVRRITPESCG